MLQVGGISISEEGLWETARWEIQNCTTTGDTSRSTHSLPLLCNRDRRIVDGQFGFSVLVWTLPSFILGQRDQSIVLL